MLSPDKIEKNKGCKSPSTSREEQTFPRLIKINKKTFLRGIFYGVRFRAEFFGHSNVVDNHKRTFTKKKIPVPISTVSHKALFSVLTPDVKANVK